MKEYSRVKSRVQRERSRISSLDVLLCAVALLLAVNLVCMVLGVNVNELPTALTVVWWSSVSVVVAVIASWGM